MTLPDPLPIAPAAKPLVGNPTIPGSKSITNRALLTAGLATGASTLDGALDADDTVAMSTAIEALGGTVTREGRALRVTGVGGTIPDTAIELYADRSATTARFVLPVLGLGRGRYLLDAEDQMRGRPMSDGIEALRSLGVEVAELGEPGHLPVSVSGGPGSVATLALRGDVSSQFLSGFLLAGPCYPEGLVVDLEGPLVSAPFVEMTIAVMDSFGVAVDVRDDGSYRIDHGGYVAREFSVEPDASSASYFFAGAALTGGRVRVNGLGSASTQGDLEVVELLGRMGAEVQITDDWTEVAGTGELHGIDADLSACSDMTPTIAVVAAAASSPSELRGVEFARAKESDRVGDVVRELQRCGVDSEERRDGMVIRPGGLHGSTVDSHGDHRMAMAFTVLGLVAEGMSITDPGCVAKTFPDFYEGLDSMRLLDSHESS